MMFLSTPSKHFVLGFVSALSAVWISQQILIAWRQSRANSGGKDTTPSQQQSASNNDEKASETQQQQPLMDTPELDQRMIRKAEAVIQWRTSRITVVVERCTNDFNYSAILRTAEALGVQDVWIIDPPPPPEVVEGEDGDVLDVPSQTNAGRPVPVNNFTQEELRGRALHHIFARGAGEWLTVKEFHSTTDCIQALRDTQHTIWVTDLSQQAVCLTKEGLSDSANDNTPFTSLPPRLAIVFGTEAVGCSEEMLQAADLRVYLPLRGFADSLNLSVATALVLHQLFVLDPTVIGSMSEADKRQLRQEWYAKLCRQRLLTKTQKRARGRLQLHLQQCDVILAKQAKGEKLQPGELKKVALKEQYQKDLQALEQSCSLDEEGTRKLQAAIQDLVDHPPQPLSDVRRADTHRVCFVGKNTKNKHKEHWKDMAATSNADTQATDGSSATFFRERVFGLVRLDT